MVIYDSLVYFMTIIVRIVFFRFLTLLIDVEKGAKRKFEARKKNTKTETLKKRKKLTDYFNLTKIRFE